MRGNGPGVVALGLGILGLFTGGLLVFGSLLGLGLGIWALTRARRQGGGDVAWAAVAANVFALLSVAPLAMLLVALRPVLFPADEGLPDPIAETYRIFEEPAAPPPPPPPPPPPAATGGPRPVVESGLANAERAPTEDGAPLRVGGEIREPRKLRSVNPVYPEIAKQARVQGLVILECVIGPEGEIRHVKVLRGIPLLDQAAVDAVRQWRYTPTLLDGRAVPVIMTVTVNFRLN